MGYSITKEQADKLERYDREGRRCHMATRGGGCFSRATWVETHQSWDYRIDEGDSRLSDVTFCGRHHSAEGYRGVNFIVVAVRRLGRAATA